MLFQNCHQKQTKIEVIKAPISKLACDTSFQLISVYHDSVTMCIPKYFFLNKVNYRYAYFDTDGKQQLTWYQGKFRCTRITLFWERIQYLCNDDSLSRVFYIVFDSTKAKRVGLNVSHFRIKNHFVGKLVEKQAECLRYDFIAVLKENKKLLHCTIEVDYTDTLINQMEINKMINSTQLNY
jgi:hypothetical protein